MRVDGVPSSARRRRGASAVETVQDWPPLANALLKVRRIPRTTLEAAVIESKNTGQPLEAVLYNLGVSEDEVLRGVAEMAQIKFVDLERYSFNASAASLIPFKVAKQHCALPIGWEYGTPVIAMANPDDVVAKDEIKSILGREFLMVLAPKNKILQYMGAIYGEPVDITQNQAVAPEVGDSIFATMFATGVDEIQEVSEVPTAQTQSRPNAERPDTASVATPAPDVPVSGVTENSGAQPLSVSANLTNNISEAKSSISNNGSNMTDTYEDQSDSVNVPGYDLSSFTGGSILFDDDLGAFGEEEDEDLSGSLAYLDELGFGEDEEEDSIPPLANSLIAAGKITPDQMEAALAERKATGKPLAQILSDSGAVSEADLIEAMARENGLSFIDLTEYPIDEEAATRIPLAIARRHRVLLVGFEGERALVAVANPSDMVAMDDLRSLLGREFKPLIAVPSQIIEYIDKVYKSDEETRAAAEEASKSVAKSVVAESQGLEITNLESVAEDAPVIRFVNSIILQAVNERASDIHVEPTQTDLRVRYRIDGVLHDFNRAPRNIADAVISRLKVMGQLNIAEHRIPQDGRISLTAGSRQLDLRIALLPTITGEKIVMRILDKSHALMSLEDLGFYSDFLDRYEGIYTKPYGTILVTGPTGSGKSTTLYSTLNIINSPDKHIITVEDPVEYQLSGIIQMQVNPKAGLTFAKCLRAILRGDPDIVLVGEIRDFETAQIAIEAALTGHLVLSSVHTNDAASTPLRLLEMGVERFLVGSALLGVVTQRLARKLCTKCKEPYEASDEELAVAGIDQDTISKAKEITLFRPAGCPACSKTGYRGRMSVAELMIMTESIERLLFENASTEEIRRQAIKEGMITMKQDGFRKALEGQTSIEEVLRVVI